MIKTLLFDFGDVFLNLDKKATLQELKKVGLEEFSSEMIQFNQDYEIGAVSSEEFIAFYREKIPQASSEAIKKAWNSVLIDFPKHRLRFLQDLHQKFQLLLFSNTNDLHIRWVSEHIQEFETFKDCFDGFYLSHEINLRKPNAESFRYILAKHQLNPKEVLFIDDTAENTETAKKLGMHVWNIDPSTEDITELFSAKKELFYSM